MKTPEKFHDRTEAGRQLARALHSYADREDVVVLALPRGGVPVGFEVAKALHCPLDVLIVRKLGVPGQEELAMGAIASGGVRELNLEVVKLLKIAPRDIDEVARREQRELERREHVYRGHRPPLDVHDRVVLLIDDGLATGTTMRAAVSALRKLGAKRIVAAIPVGASQSCNRLREDVDDLVCLVEPDGLYAISVWYDEFPQTSDEEVQHLVKKAEPGLSHELAGGKYVF